MKTLLLSLSLIVLSLAGCAVDPVKVDGTNNNQVQVQTLFTKDGCTVYRFFDMGHAVYYVVCEGKSAMATWPQPEGKTTIPMTVQTVNQ